MHSKIEFLIDGYKHFRQKYFEESTVYKDLVEQGQKPKALIIACCDSRVDPAIITDCKPGELFVVRNVANLVPPCKNDSLHHGTSAALEFGVTGLNITDIIVFGHSHCGGIQALMNKDDSTPTENFINPWMAIAKPAKEQVLREHSEASKSEQESACEKASLLISLNNLQTFPWIKERLTENKIFLHAWYFNLNTGIVERYQPETQTFTPLDK